MAGPQAVTRPLRRSFPVDKDSPPFSRRGLLPFDKIGYHHTNFNWRDAKDFVRNHRSVFILWLAILASACGSTPQPNIPSGNAANSNNNSVKAPSPAPTAEVAAVRSGKDLYTIHCMTCHKDSGKGGKVTVEGKQLDPDDLTSANMKAKSDDKLFGYISDGIEDEGMPAFKDKLKPDEIKAVVAHLRELQK